MALLRKRRSASRGSQQNQKWRIIAIAAIVLALVIAYIIYAVVQSGKEPKDAVQNSMVPELQSADAVIASQLPSEGENASDGDAAAPLGSNGNTVANFLSAFQLRWDKAYTMLQGQQEVKDVSYAFVAMDIAHADIFRDISKFQSASTADLESGTAPGAMKLAMQVGDPTTYDFTMQTSQGQPLTGKVKLDGTALYYIIENTTGDTIRFVEIVNQGTDCFVQLLTVDGPYKGILFFDLKEDGSIFAARMSEEMYRQSGGIQKIYYEPPASWETFSAKGTPFFSAGTSGTQQLLGAIDENAAMGTADGTINSGVNDAAGSNIEPMLPTEGTSMGDVASAEPAATPMPAANGESTNETSNDLPNGLLEELD